MHPKLSSTKWVTATKKTKNTPHSEEPQESIRRGIQIYEENGGTMFLINMQGQFKYVAATGIN